ncbi:MAG: hypothetical protein J6Z24_08670 [Oscillospiraceae bacterium]|nr:hypothetical protein [Oscillospiraceae bacterium]
MSDDRRYSHEYDDIIGLPHHTSSRHPRLPMSSRAAQFAPFAALTGFEGVIAEKGRLTDSFTELDDDMKEDIDLKLELLGSMVGDSPKATFTYFVPDRKKEGGSYSTVTGRIKKIDDIERIIILKNGTRIRIDDLFSITGEVFREYFPD